MARGQTLYRILFTVENLIIASFRHPGRTSRSAYLFFREFDQLQDLSNRELQAMARYAEERKYVRVDPKTGALVLGEEGKSYLARQRLLLKKPKYWDGKWRIVMFDVPNTRKRARDSLAYTLKRVGFEPLQKSVFVYPHECEKEIRTLAEHLDIGKCVEVIQTDTISTEAKLRKRFKIS